MEKYLKDISYYENIYDDLMIESCIRLKETTKKVVTKNKVEEKLNMDAFWSFLVMNEKYNWYKDRDETIDKRMEKDRKIDHFIENSQPFKGKHCRLCNGTLEYESKEYRSGSDKNTDRILFFYKCSDCNKRQGIYSDGEEIISKPKKCNKCGEIINHKAIFKGDILVEDFECVYCGNKYYKKTDYSTKNRQETKISERDRLDYGYNKKQKEEILRHFHNLEMGAAAVDKILEKEKKKDIYDKVKKLEKLNVVKLQKLLNKNFNETKFSEFKIISDNKVRGGIEIEYSLFFDGDIGENPKLKLNKLLEKLLLKTNWRSRKDSINERLGIVNGKLVGFDNEDELVKLIEKREKKKS